MKFFRNLSFIALLVLASAWIWVSRVPLVAQVAKDVARPVVGYPAPDFRLKTLDETVLALGDLRGRPVVLNFWATWCGPCRRELPALQKATLKYADKVSIIGVDQGEDAETVRAFVEELGLSFTIPLDQSHDVANAYEVTLMPTTYFIDADGIIRSVVMGEMNSLTLAENIAGILR